MSGRNVTYVAQNVYWRGATIEDSTPDYACAEFETFDAAVAHAIGRAGQSAPPDAIPGGVFEPHFDVTEYEAISPVEHVPVRRWIYDGGTLEETIEGEDL